MNARCGKDELRWCGGRTSNPSATSVAAVRFCLPCVFTYILLEKGALPSAAKFNYATTPKKGQRFALFFVNFTSERNKFRSYRKLQMHAATYFAHNLQPSSSIIIHLSDSNRTRTNNVFPNSKLLPDTVCYIFNPPPQEKTQLQTLFVSCTATRSRPPSTPSTIKTTNSNSPLPQPNHTVPVLLLNHGLS